MKNWKLKLAKWLLKTDGWIFVAVRTEGGNVDIEGDIPFIRNLDIHSVVSQSQNGK